MENYKRDRELWEKIKNLQQKELVFLRKLLLEKDNKIQELEETWKKEFSEKDEKINYLLNTITTLEERLICYEQEGNTEYKLDRNDILLPDQQFLIDKLKYHHMVSNLDKSDQRVSYRSERLPSFNKFLPISEKNPPSPNLKEKKMKKEKPTIIVENYESENEENEVP